MIDLEGRRKAVFNAYALYARMPIDRRRMTVDGPTGEDSVKGCASADAHRAAVLVWNASAVPQTITLDLDGLPFAGGVTRLYRVDAGHASGGGGAAYVAAHPAFPWGTRRAADGVVNVTDADAITIDAAAHAPAGWTGRAQVTFLLWHAGPKTHAAFRISALPR